MNSNIWAFVLHIWAFATYFLFLDLREAGAPNLQSPHPNKMLMLTWLPSLFPPQTSLKFGLKIFPLCLTTSLRIRLLWLTFASNSRWNKTQVAQCINCPISYFWSYFIWWKLSWTSDPKCRLDWPVIRELSRRPWCIMKKKDFIRFAKNIMYF